jgi:hypothetical protein
MGCFTGGKKIISTWWLLLAIRIMKISSVIKYIVLLTLIMSFYLIWILRIDYCTLKSCEFPEIMMEVAKAQLLVEDYILNRSKKIPVRNIVSPHLSFALVTINGDIIIERKEDQLLIVFEPSVNDTHVEWKCYGKPSFLFDSSYKSGIADCGATYRNIIK